MRVCLTFRFLGMLRQNNLAHLAASTFNKIRHICMGDVLLVPPGILLIVHWTKAIQVVGRYPVLPIPAIPSHPADPVAAYRQLIQASHRSSPNQPLLTITTGACQQVITLKNALQWFGSHARCLFIGLLPVLPPYLVQGWSHFSV